MFVGLTWTVPLRAALVSVHQYGKTQQATVGRLRGKRAALGLIKEHQLVVDADVLCAFIDNLCIRRLEMTDRKPESHKTTTQSTETTERTQHINQRSARISTITTYWSELVLKWTYCAHPYSCGGQRRCYVRRLRWSVAPR